MSDVCWGCPTYPLLAPYTLRKNFVHEGLVIVLNPPVVHGPDIAMEVATIPTGRSVLQR